MDNVDIEKRFCDLAQHEVFGVTEVCVKGGRD